MAGMKRKPSAGARQPKRQRKASERFEWDDVGSDNEDDVFSGGGDAAGAGDDDEGAWDDENDAAETADEKRLRLAQDYIDTIDRTARRSSESDGSDDSDENDAFENPHRGGAGAGYGDADGSGAGGDRVGARLHDDAQLRGKRTQPCPRPTAPGHKPPGPRQPPD